MNYYSINQIPNFLLALPMLIFLVYSIISYAKSDYYRFFTIGMRSKKHDEKSINASSHLPFHLLAVTMLFLLLTMMHVQIITRFFVAMPIVYWKMASVIHERKDNKKSDIADWYIFYCISYSAIGVVLFSNFMPPA